eukprot:CAMPEP_0119319200 /NCGR_PEP_ID=MMETSP1333-20130426/48726_1 /TAXON_ID=418940 /ORGANISM="Scyphosphaera apsteinii, Strain RCC1455" /LENGTH=109 /DNA_ID=CAMNT_0007325555 /DNA_START=139 /DNA_END=468 /DNA_ORIENTATION=-
MAKKQFDEKAVPDASCLLGVKEDGSQHRWVVGNEEGEILPKFLWAKFVAIESGKVFGKPLKTTTDVTQRDRLYAMAREAQLRGIQPFKLKEEGRGEISGKGKKRCRQVA